MSSTSWRALEEASLAKPIARDVVSRLHDVNKVDHACQVATQRTQYPPTSQWRNASISMGNAGLAVFASVCEQCFPDEEWERYGFYQLNLAIEDLYSQPYSKTGLFNGFAGLAFATWLLSNGEKRYQKLLASLDGQIIPEVNDLLTVLKKRRSGFPCSQFDAIAGITGTAAYLLCRKSNSTVYATLEKVLHFLVELTEEEHGIPRWHVPSEFVSSLDQELGFGEGLLDAGIAHGIAGPLAILSLAASQEVDVPQLHEAIHRAAGWLVSHRVDDEWGVNWGTLYPLYPTDNPNQNPFPSRTAWCYGSPGIARALWLAGQATGCVDYCNLAIEAMTSIYRKPIKERKINAAVFCHGVAGLLQITMRFLHDTKLPLFREAAQDLLSQLLSLYEPQTDLGFCEIEEGDIHIDHPGLLTGVPGVALVLLAATTNYEPIWDRLFLLS